MRFKNPLKNLIQFGLFFRQSFKHPLWTKILRDCTARGGIKQCPPNLPIMCANLACGAMSDRYCCEVDANACTAKGGVRECTLKMRISSVIKTIITLEILIIKVPRPPRARR